MRNRRFGERKTVEIPVFTPTVIVNSFSQEEIAGRAGTSLDLSESDMSVMSANLLSADATQELPVIQEDLT
jgi:hypothetical protein